MTERERQHRLRIENRLAELAAKHGRLPEPEPWDETYPWAQLISPLVPEPAPNRGKPRQTAARPPAKRAGSIWERA